MSHIIDKVLPALGEVGDHALRQALENAFGNETEALSVIEHCFDTVTGADHSPEKLKHFFRSWMMTNNSASCVSGLGNRMTMQALNDASAHKADVLEALTSLHRISDEDLGVGSGLLHWELYCRMANSICMEDDWQCSRYLTSEAELFKRWKDKCALKESDLMMGLLTTLIHEIYTHGEVEYIEPMFQNWLAQNSDSSESERRRNLFWITAHCNGTETAHFGHAQHATQHYCRAYGIRLADYDMELVFRDYLKRKARVMASITHVLDGDMLIGLKMQSIKRDAIEA
jgi:hypothetical protein